ncbi:MAG: HEAT repeat domain-containing protein [Candidatus Thorarchaeota archaeon]
MVNKDLFRTMVKKLLEHPDRFERIFAAQYLARYTRERSEKFLYEALADPDPEVVACVQHLLGKIQQGRKEP